MIQNIRFFLVILIIQCFAFNTYSSTEQCNDTHKIYKVCGDQTNIYDEAINQANKSNKLLLITFGFEECPSCQSLHKLLESYSFKSQFQNKLVVIEIGMYNGPDIEFTGQVVFDTVAEMNPPSEGQFIGYPYLAIVNPESKKAITFNPGPLADNQLYEVLENITTHLKN